MSFAIAFDCACGQRDESESIRSKEHGDEIPNIECTPTAQPNAIANDIGRGPANDDITSGSITESADSEWKPSSSNEWEY
jgi:hypothetical protein